MSVNAKVASAYVDLVAHTEAFHKALDDATASTKKWSASMREEAQKSRESVRLLSEELGVHIPRGLQSIISKLPGVSTALNAAFDSVVVVGLIDVIVEAGKKIYEFVEKEEEAAKKNAEAHRALSDSLVKQNLEMQVSNDKLDDQIAKLEHKPADRLRASLDEARLAAFDLSAELEKAIDKERELLDASGANFMRRVLGAAGNEAIKPGLNDYQEQSKAVNLRYDQRLDGAKPGEVEKIEIERRKELLALTEKYYNALTQEIDKRKELAAILAKPSDSLTDAERDRFRNLNAEFAATNSNGSQGQIIAALQALRADIGAKGWGQSADIDRTAKNGQIGALSGDHAFTVNTSGADAASAFEQIFGLSPDEMAAALEGQAIINAATYARFGETQGAHDSLDGQQVGNEPIYDMDLQGKNVQGFKYWMDLALQEWIDKLADIREALTHLMEKSLSTVNDVLGKEMSGQYKKGDWSKAGKSILDDASQSGLRVAEGNIMKLFGLDSLGGGKLGSKGNPMYTKDADAAAPGLGAAAGGLLGKLNDSNWASSLFGGMLFGSGSLFGGGHALGGAVAAGVPIDVGELGRERFVPQVPGRIISNRDLGRGGTTMHIDARGTDPSLTRENFQRALAATHRQSVHDAGIVMAERNRRVPH